MFGIIVYRKEGESLDSLLNRFSDLVWKSGILKDYLRKVYYLKPSEIRRKKEFFRKLKQKKKKTREKREIPWEKEE